VRFYPKYIKANLGKIARHSYALKSLTSLPEWNTIMGLQFENLVLNSRTQLHRLIQVKPEEIVNESVLSKTDCSAGGLPDRLHDPVEIRDSIRL
jgi:uncharacterized protein